ncbi:MAG: protein kinase [Lysobacteraceae bacterium]
MRDNSLPEIPGYQLLRRIGRGGMAEVWLAVQASLGREVALKFLSPEMACDDTTRERFLQEARIAAQLHHPNIIAIYDVGTAGDTAYIAMEYESHGTVSPAPGRAMDPDAALAIVRDIVEALDYAHQKGVVHRDVKPDNILRRANGRCLLSDFGIARIMDAETVLTLEGTSVGTPHYMSPEQLRGEKLDGRSDFYSLGVALYQLLTGALPYSGSDGWAIGMQHISADIPQLPAPLARTQPLINALMAKAAKDRPQCGAEIIALINSVLPSASAAPTVEEQRSMPRLRRTMPRWLLAITAVAAVAVLLAAGVLLRRPTSPAPMAASQSAVAKAAPTSALALPVQPSIAVLPLSDQGGGSDGQYFSDGLSESLITALAQFDQLKVIGRHSAFQFRDSTEDSKTIGRKLGVAHLLLGSVRHAGNTVRVNVELINVDDGSTLWSQQYDRPYTGLFKLQDEITAAVASALKAKLIDPAQAAAQRDRPPGGSLAAYNAYLQGNFYAQAQTEAGYRKAIAFFADAVRIDPRYAMAHVRLAGVWMGLASNLILTGQQARQAFDHARAAVDTALALQPDLAAAHGARGDLLAAADFDWSGAQAEYRRSVQLDPGSAYGKASLGFMLSTLGRLDEAIALTREAMAIDPLNPGLDQSLAWLLAAAGRLDEAEALVRKAIQSRPDAPDQFAQLTRIQVQRGDAAAALAVARQAPASAWADYALALAAQIGSDRKYADQTLHTLIDKDSQFSPVLIADVYSLRSDPDQVFAWLERARVHRDPSIVWLLSDVFILRYSRDPRFAELTHKLGLPSPGARGSK